MINIQNVFFNNILKENVAVTVFLLSGFQLKGHIKAFDNFTIILSVEGKEQIIFKHAISTILPAENVSYRYDK